jgi:hypothetical protein
MKKKALAGLLVAGLSLWLPATAEAESPQSTGPSEEFPLLPDQQESGPLDCTFRMSLQFATPLAGDVQSTIASFDCPGQVFNGQTVTGPGLYTMKGRYTSICAFGLLEGTYTVLFSTAQGPLALTGNLNIEWGPFAGHLAQQMGDRTFDGGFAGFPTTGGPCFGGQGDIAGGGYLN